MTTGCSDARLIPLALSREQRWIVHAVLLEHVELARSVGTAPGELSCELGVLEALEAGDSAFTVDELDRVRHELASYVRAADTPDRDRPVARDMVDRLDGVLAARVA